MPSSILLYSAPKNLILIKFKCSNCFITYDFNFKIINFPNMCSNIPASPAYGVGNPGLDWRRTLKCSGATPVNEVTTLPS
jgi:hypothetical protein